MNKALLARVENVFKQTQAVIDQMKVGDRMQLKEMAEAVSKTTGMDSKEAVLYVSAYAHETDSGYVARGKKGGFIKGTRPVKVSAPVDAPVDVKISA